MRPNRTLAFALLATAAALASGCAEPELEPDWEAAVDALVEEAGSGLLAGGGNPLADGDGWDFRCGGTGSFDGDKQDCRQ